MSNRPLIQRRYLLKNNADSSLNEEYMDLEYNIPQVPDSFQVFEELVRYYSGCGYTESQASSPGFFRCLGGLFLLGLRINDS